MAIKRMFLILSLLICGCGPMEHCRKLPIKTEWFDGATWDTIRYVGAHGEVCADITKRSTWSGWAVFVGNRQINEDRGYTLDEAQKFVESRYCKL